MLTTFRLAAFFAFALLLCTCGPAQTEAEEVVTALEGGDTTTSVLQLNYLDLDLPERYYLVFRQELSLLDVNGFIGMESEALMLAATKAGVVATGPPTVLTYEWDTEKGWSDVAVALPVAADTKLPPYVTIALPATEALVLDLEGSYDALSAMHVALDRELNRRGLRFQLPAIEEYPVGPQQTSDPEQFRTRILYPYETPEQ